MQNGNSRLVRHGATISLVAGVIGGVLALFLKHADKKQAFSFGFWGFWLLFAAAIAAVLAIDEWFAYRDRKLSEKININGS